MGEDTGFPLKVKLLLTMRTTRLTEKLSHEILYPAVHVPLSVYREKIENLNLPASLSFQVRILVMVRIC